jgi:probable rRNA maturation factor
MISVEIHPSILIESELVERAAHATLKHESISDDPDLTIVLTDDEQLQDLNRDYRDIDAPTDVLSFPASESDPETGRRYIGDILISVQRAEEQASAAGHALESELQLLIVHGVLHLLGYDHGEAEEKVRMWAAQSAVLAKLGLSGIKISE